MPRGAEIHAAEPISSFYVVALGAFRATAIELTRRRRSARALAAAVQALLDQQHAALRELVCRRQAVTAPARPLALQSCRAQSSIKRAGERRARLS